MLRSESRRKEQTKEYTDLILWISEIIDLDEGDLAEIARRAIAGCLNFRDLTVLLQLSHFSGYLDAGGFKNGFENLD